TSTRPSRRRRSPSRRPTSTGARAGSPPTRPRSRSGSEIWPSASRHSNRSAGGSWRPSRSSRRNRRGPPSASSTWPRSCARSKAGVSRRGEFLDERERGLDVRAEQLRAEADARVAELDSRDSALAEREQEVEAREQQVRGEFERLEQEIAGHGESTAEAMA